MSAKIPSDSVNLCELHALQSDILGSFDGFCKDFSLCVQSLSLDRIDSGIVYVCLFANVFHA